MQPILDNFIFQFLENLFPTSRPTLGDVNLGVNTRYPFVEKVLEPNSFPKKKGGGGWNFTMNCYFIT